MYQTAQPEQMGGTTSCGRAGVAATGGSTLSLIYYEISVKNFVYYSMEIILKIGQEEYSISRDIDNPDTDNVMYAIESLVNMVPGLDTTVVEEYILGWAEEIQNKK